MALFQNASKALRKWGPAALTTFFMAANANAADPARFVQVADLDLSKPVPSNICVKDDDQGHALDKIETIRKARGQTYVIEADSLHQKSGDSSPYAGVTFTSNLKPSTIKGFLGEGYMIISNAPKGEQGTSYCFNISNSTTGIVSAINGTKVPSAVNIGELGAGLNNAMTRSDSKVGYIGVTTKKTWVAVTFNHMTKKGGYVLADGEGNGSLPIALVNVGYSRELPSSYKKALGIPVDDVASAGSDIAMVPR